jgi:hypothetical protein
MNKKTKELWKELEKRQIAPIETGKFLTIGEKDKNDTSCPHKQFAKNSKVWFCTITYMECSEKTNHVECPKYIEELNKQ